MATSSLPAVDIPQNLDPQSCAWFDADNEGPYTLEEVEARVRSDGGNQQGFHLCRRPDLRYELVFPCYFNKLVTDHQFGQTPAQEPDP